MKGMYIWNFGDICRRNCRTSIGFGSSDGGKTYVEGEEIPE
jgi:hypothetical protein